MTTQVVTEASSLISDLTATPTSPDIFGVFTSPLSGDATSLAPTAAGAGPVITPNSVSTVPNGEVNGGWSSDGDAFEDQLWIRLCYGIIATLGIFGNFTVMFTVFRVRSMRTLTNMFIVSLAGADFVTSVFLIPLHLGLKIPVPAGVGGEMLCRLLLSKFPLWTSFVASVLNLTAVTLERYFSIVHPLHYDAIFTAKKAGVMIFTVWVAGIVMNSYMLYIFFNDNGVCTISWPNTEYQTFVGVANFCVIYVIPIAVMGISYWLIMANLSASARRLKQATREGKSGPMSMELLSARKKVVKMLAIVVVTFAICWAPNQFVFFAYNCGWNLDFNSWYYHLTVLVAFCNSCMNPFIYAFKSKQYRKALRAAVFGKKLTTTISSHENTNPSLAGSSAGK
ncbi:galanin receptor 2a-like [Diadema antillarum]|uniref:galanin receptor 2a-like n=1 Tax=Diadema antillarum TaxID=105358 RepID=UPI003A847860